MGRKKKQPNEKLKCISVYAPSDLFEKLSRLAKTMEIGKSRLIRSAISRMIAEAEAEVHQILMEQQRTKNTL